MASTEEESEWERDGREWIERTSTDTDQHAHNKQILVNKYHKNKWKKWNKQKQKKR